MEIRLLSDIQAFENLRDPWNKLLPQNPVQDVFYTWEWLFAWWKHYGKQRELWLVTAWIADELVGVAPLMLETRKKYGLRVRVLCNLGTLNIDIGGFLVRDGDQRIYAEIGNYLIKQKAQWDLLELNEFLLDSPESRQLIALFTDSGFIHAHKDNHHFYLPIQGNWQSYLQHLSSNLRGDIRKKNKRLNESQGELIYKHHTGREVTWQDFLAIFEINEHGRFPYLYRSAEERAFQRELFEAMTDRGWLDIHLLYIGILPVAYLYGFLYNNRFENWRTGFNSLYSKFSVGKILHLMVIEDCFKRAVTEIDFLCGEEIYKTHWQTVERTYTQLRFVPRNRLVAMVAYIWPPRLKALLDPNQ
jgi:CelD/BcsL family acetyltransferase involved in cellulose biosynthesis